MCICVCVCVLTLLQETMEMFNLFSRQFEWSGSIEFIRKDNDGPKPPTEYQQFMSSLLIWTESY